MDKHTFKSVFGDGGNTAEINHEWWCEKCGEKLSFRLIVEDLEYVKWEGVCCGDVYTIDPYIAVYCKEPQPLT